MTRAERMELMLAAATKLEEAANLLQKAEEGYVADQVREVANVLDILTPADGLH